MLTTRALTQIFYVIFFHACFDILFYCISLECCFAHMSVCKQKYEYIIHSCTKNVWELFLRLVQALITRKCMYVSASGLFKC
jgi:hypothetical protein